MKLLPLLIIVIASCQPKGQLYQASGENIILLDSTFADKELEQLVSPYRKKMASEMNAQIGTAKQLLNNSKTAIESDLGNWMADVVFETGFKYLNSLDPKIGSDNCFALLNKGGIRAPINKGPITIGNVFEVMPFNNEIVIVKLEPNRIKQILDYLFVQNGQPVSNVEIKITNKSNTIKIGTVIFNFLKPVYIVTSDYLAKGGDKMDFFKNPISVLQTGILIRDALLKKVETVKTIALPINTGRIQLMNNNE